MLPKIPVLMEVSYQEYIDNINNEKVHYHRQFVIPSYLTSPEEIFEFVNENLNNVHNTDINRYYKSMGVISNSETEEQEDRLNKLSISN